MKNNRRHSVLKLISALALVFVMLFSLAACDGGQVAEEVDVAAISEIALDILEDYGCLLDIASGDVVETASDEAQSGDSSALNEPTRGETREAVAEGPYRVVRVVDGDTMVLDMDGTEEKVRLIGIDTPESVHPDESRNVEYGKIASEYSKSMLEGQEVYVEYDVQERDRYGRILAYVYLGERMYNQVLLAEGHAKVATYPPNVRYVDDFTAIQGAARENGVGLWAIEDDGSENLGSGTSGNESASVSVGTVGNVGTQTNAGADGALSDTYKYVGNKNSKVFHMATCPSVGRMKESNRVGYDSRDGAVAAGYEPCANCNP